MIRAQAMIILKNLSSFMTSYSHHKVFVSVQEDNVVAHSRIKHILWCDWIFCFCFFLNLTIRKCFPQRHYYNPARRLSAKLKVGKQKR